MNEIIENINRIKDRIVATCERVGRQPNEVQLLLATKTVPPERIAIALKAGHTLIAENKVQELKEKFEALKSVPHTSHFIGHLQTNKIKDIIRYGVSCIQSVDRLDLAEKLQQRLQTTHQKIDVLLQVNTSGEKSKFGVSAAEAIGLAKAVSQLDTLKIKGLMTIGLFSAETARVRDCFRLLRTIKQEIEGLQLPGVSMQELSMGMSGDFETAIEEGATIIRVGTSVFGQRKTPDSYYWNEGGPS